MSDIPNIQLAAKSLELNLAQQSIASLALQLTKAQAELGSVKTALKVQAEEALKQIETLNTSNVGLLKSLQVTREAGAAQAEKDNNTIASLGDEVQDLQEDMTGLRHELERREIICGFLFEQQKKYDIVPLPYHESLGKKAKTKADLQLVTDRYTFSAALTYIDDLYQKLDNPELRGLLKG